LSFTYQKTLELNNTHSWLEEKIFNHLKKINETVEEIHKKLKEQYDQALN
jgi:predicted ribosome quality control (RQC) complex YloA/Tae2 family protein